MFCQFILSYLCCCGPLQVQLQQLVWTVCGVCSASSDLRLPVKQMVGFDKGEKLVDWGVQLFKWEKSVFVLGWWIPHANQHKTHTHSHFSWMFFSPRANPLSLPALLSSHPDSYLHTPKLVLSVKHIYNRNMHAFPKI